MSLAIHQPRDTATRRPRRKQEPSLSVTEGRLQPAARITRPPRRIGRGGTAAERRRISDGEIEKHDAAGLPRWMIAAAVGLSESQVYRRLKALRKKREAARAILAEMADTTLYG